MLKLTIAMAMIVILAGPVFASDCEHNSCDDPYSSENCTSEKTVADCTGDCSGERDDADACENCTCEEVVEGCTGDCCECEAEECEEACTCQCEDCEHTVEAIVETPCGGGGCHGGGCQ